MTTTNYADEIALGSDRLLYLGRTTGPNGLKGQLSVDLIAGEESILKKGMTVHLLPKESNKTGWKSLKNSYQEVAGTYELKISFLQHMPKKAVLSFEGIIDRTHVEQLGAFGLYISRSLFPKCSQGEYYWADLLGLTVMSQEGGSVVGKVTDVYDNGVQTVLKLLLESDTDSEEELDLPFVESFFPKVDLAQKMIWVNLPEVW